MLIYKGLNRFIFEKTTDCSQGQIVILQILISLKILYNRDLNFNTFIISFFLNYFSIFQVNNKH